MEHCKSIFKNVWPYQKDQMSPPVKDLKTSIPFYTAMNFQILYRQSEPHKSAVLGRDNIQIGLAENGGDQSQEECFFEVYNIESTFAELSSNVLKKEISQLDVEQFGEVFWKVFYVVAPDGLCYCIGEQQK